MPDSPSLPTLYAERLAARRAAAAGFRAQRERLSWARLGAFLAGLATAGLAFGTGLLSPLLALVPVVGLFVLIAKFEAAGARLNWAERAARFYLGGLDRLDGKPAGPGDGSTYSDESHPYAADLDLFGPGSVFERLTACRTRAGEETLARWLKAPADPPEVASRQAAVADLTPRLDLREVLAVAGADIPGGAELDWLAQWGNAPREPIPAWKPRVVEVLGWGNVLAWCGWLLAGTTSIPVAVFGLASLAVALPLNSWARRVIAPLEPAEAALSLLEAILARFEQQAFSAERLRELQAALRADEQSAAAQIRELRGLLNWLNAQRNAFFLPVAVLRMWRTRYAFKFEAWRARSGPRVAEWIRAVGEAEALSSFAGHAFENPRDVFPTVISGPARFDATGLGHPLIPADRCVRNDLRLGGDSGPRVLVVSGSNMSGKSTLLRAVGVNAVLALAGGVVRAASLSLTPVALGATMRVQDSLQAGRSRFFAEVSKVRHLLDVAATNRPPLLFLLDELFSGTNSADRVAGAEGVLRALLAAGAIGLVTTHDLALTAITARLAGAANVHFSDGLAGGELQFDFTMRPGVVPHGNGLALMRAVGLQV